MCIVFNGLLDVGHPFCTSSLGKHMEPKISQLSNEENLGWLGYIGDYTTQVYRDPYQPTSVIESKKFFLFVAQLKRKIIVQTSNFGFHVNQGWHLRRLRTVVLGNACAAKVRRHFMPNWIKLANRTFSKIHAKHTMYHMHYSTCTTLYTNHQEIGAFFPRGPR